MLCGGRRACAEGGRAQLHRAARLRSDAAHQYPRGSRRHGGGNWFSFHKDHDRLQLGGPDGKRAAERAGGAMAAERCDRARAGERPQPPRTWPGRAALCPAVRFAEEEPLWRRRGGRAVRLRARRAGRGGARHRLHQGHPGGARNVKFSIQAIDFFERDVRLRMPFRFGVVTLTEAPQAFVRVKIALEDKKSSEGAAAELLAPKWFDKNPALSNEDNFEQLRQSMRAARAAYLSDKPHTAYGHSRPTVGLVENYGPALIDRALLDALCRALGISFYEAIRTNVVGLDLPPRFLESLRPREAIAARHTVGLVDPITAIDNKTPVGDGLPETLEQVIERYGHRWFKL